MSVLVSRFCSTFEDYGVSMLLLGVVVAQGEAEATMVTTDWPWVMTCMT